MSINYHYAVQRRSRQLEESRWSTPYEVVPTSRPTKRKRMLRLRTISSKSHSPLFRLFCAWTCRYATFGFTSSIFEIWDPDSLTSAEFFALPFFQPEGYLSLLTLHFHYLALHWKPRLNTAYFVYGICKNILFWAWLSLPSHASV